MFCFPILDVFVFLGFVVKECLFKICGLCINLTTYEYLNTAEQNKGKTEKPIFAVFKKCTYCYFSNTAKGCKDDKGRSIIKKEAPK